jgi:hypothetical protein
MQEAIFTQTSFDKLTNEQVVNRLAGYLEMAEIHYRLTGEPDSDFAEYAKEFEAERDRRIHFLLTN